MLSYSDTHTSPGAPGEPEKRKRVEGFGFQSCSRLQTAGMRWWLVVASLWLLVVLNTPDAQARGRPRNHDGRREKRKRDGEGHGRGREGRSRPLKIRLVPGPNISVNPAENQRNVGSYRTLREQPSSYNVIPGKQDQCVYQGLTMFNQAVWSPKPCVTCLCDGGRVVCDEVICPITHCLFPFVPTGDCCPVCMEPGRNTTCENTTVQHPEAAEISADWKLLIVQHSVESEKKSEVIGFKCKIYSVLNLQLVTVSLSEASAYCSCYHHDGKNVVNTFWISQHTCCGGF